MAKIGSPKYQIQERLKHLDCRGTSRHDAKQAYRLAAASAGVDQVNPAAAAGVYSTQTMRTYEQQGTQAARWIRDTYGIKDIGQVGRDHIKSYLQHCRDQGQSAWSVSTAMAACNKIWGADLTKKECDLETRRLQDITRNRSELEYHKSCNRDNYLDQITVAKAFGLRRESICGGQYQIRPSSICKSGDGRIYAEVVEKGGRYRAAPCRQEYADDVMQILGGRISEREPAADKRVFTDRYNKTQEDPLFDRYTSKIPNHAFRAEYAQGLYAELRDQGIPDRDARQEVSYALGHNRLSVLRNYGL